MLGNKVEAEDAAQEAFLRAYTHLHSYDPNRLGYFGRLKKYKSVDHFIKAFAKIKDDYPDLKIEIIDYIFFDGFDIGNTTAWSVTVPPP